MNEGSKLEEIVRGVSNLFSGNSFLDVGTGFGTVITALLTDRNRTVTSIDPEAWYFDEIRKVYVNEIRDRRLSLETVNAAQMPYKDGSFDTSVSICSLHHMKDPVKGMAEMERVTSGRVIITDWDPSSSGSHNPHTPRELENNKKAILTYARNRGYRVEEKGAWFLAWTSRNRTV